MSDTVKVFRVDPQPIEGADRVAVVHVDGFSCVVAKDQWNPGDLGAWVPPDSLVDTGRPEFSFLKATHDKYHRVKAKKIRGVRSFGLLVKAPEGSAVGQDVTEALGVLHYNPEIPGTNAESVPGPGLFLGKYDIENGRKWMGVLQHGEQVQVTEKLHGANARYVFQDGKFHCGSRNEWKAEGSLWHSCLTEEMKDLLCTYPGAVLYGEVYGNVKGFRYDCAPGQVKFRAFDLLYRGRWVNAGLFRLVCDMYEVSTVPLLVAGMMPFDFDAVCELAEGKSTLGDHVREGVVVCPLEERAHDKLGRVKLKYVGAGYLERS